MAAPKKNTRTTTKDTKRFRLGDDPQVWEKLAAVKCVRRQGARRRHDARAHRASAGSRGSDNHLAKASLLPSPISVNGAQKIGCA
jgi:hypothetical protein